MCKKIILIHPEIGYMDNQRDAPALPLNLIHAATLLVNNYDVQLLDQRVLRDDFFKKLMEELKEQVVFIGITCLSGGTMIKNALKISRFIKENSDSLVVWGGVHASLLPEETVSDRNIDIVVVGEGEETLRELADALSEGKPLSDINGLYYKENGVSIRQTLRREFVNLDKIPLAPYELVDIGKYLQTYGGTKYLYYQASRGCPKKCSYCYNQSFNEGKFRYKSVKTVLYEIEKLVNRYSFEGIYFVDDNLFSIPKDYIKSLSLGLTKLNLAWKAQGGDIVSLNRYSRKEFIFLSNHGFKNVYIGVETGSPRMRKVINKEGDIETIKTVMNKLSGIPIIIWCSYIINLPTETLADIKMSIRLIMEIRKINPNVRNSPFYKYTPFPGTPLVQEYSKQIYLPKTLAEWSNVSWELADSPVFVDHLRDNNLFKALFLASLLSDKKLSELSTNLFVRLVGFIYRPVANFRLKHFWFKFNVELFIFEHIFKIF